MKRLRPYLIPLFLVFLVFGVYANSLNNGFVSDDIPGIVNAGPTWTWKYVFTNIIFLTRWTGIIPFILYQLTGPAPWAYRLVNITCHAVSVILIYKIVFQLVRSPLQVPDGTWLRQRWIAFIAASLFAVHPIIIESVTWISGGIYAQYGMVFLLSFWLYLKSRGQGTMSRGQKAGDNEQGTISRGQMGYYVASFFIYCVSLLFSEKAGVLFLLFFLYEFCFGNLKNNWRKLMPYFIVSCIFILFYVTKIGGRIDGVSMRNGISESSFYNPLIQLPVAFSSYFYIIFWPKDLTLYHQEVPIVGTTDYVFRVLTVCVYIFGIIFTALKNRTLCFWFVWFFIPLIPTITPLKIAWVVAERYVYLSVIGIFVLIAYVFDWVINIFIYNIAGGAGRGAPKKGSPCGYSWEKTRDRTRLSLQYFIIVFICAILVSLSFRTIVRNRDWQNEDTLWIATSKTSPSVPFTWNNMGDVYSRRGDLKKAAEMFQRAISLNPHYADAYHNLAETYRDMGETGDAILMYEKALVFNPNLWQSNGALAEIYYNKKDYQTALLHIEEALVSVPGNQMLLQARERLRSLED